MRTSERSRCVSLDSTSECKHAESSISTWWVITYTHPRRFSFHPLSSPVTHSSLDAHPPPFHLKLLGDFKFTKTTKIKVGDSGLIGVCKFGPSPSAPRPPPPPCRQCRPASVVSPTQARTPHPQSPKPKVKDDAARGQYIFTVSNVKGSKGGNSVEVFADTSQVMTQWKLSIEQAVANLGAISVASTGRGVCVLGGGGGGVGEGLVGLAVEKVEKVYSPHPGSPHPALRTSSEAPPFLVHHPHP